MNAQRLLAFASLFFLGMALTAELITDNHEHAMAFGVCALVLAVLSYHRD